MDGGEVAPARGPHELERHAEGAAHASLPSHFLSRLAHDIRSPLGLLSGALEQIREDLAAQLDESQKRMLLLAERGLTRLDRMARTLSTVAQLEDGTLRLSPQAYGLGRLVREAVESVEREDPRRGLSLEVDVPDTVTVDVDPERMREALWELVAQCCRQAVRAVRITAHAKDGSIEIRLEDDGRGLDADERRYAFDRFHEPADRRGSGLGLSVARDLVRLHGGEVELTASALPPARAGALGTCFLVRLPR